MMLYIKFVHNITSPLKMFSHIKKTTQINPKSHSGRLGSAVIARKQKEKKIIGHYLGRSIND